jgi:hypothetical protein
LQFERGVADLISRSRRLDLDGNVSIKLDLDPVWTNVTVRFFMSTLPMA